MEYSLFDISFGCLINYQKSVMDPELSPWGSSYRSVFLKTHDLFLLLKHIKME